MDVVAHTLWAAAGAVAVHRRRPLSRGTVAAELVLAALPDVMHLLPIAAWWALCDCSFAAVRGYALASPGQEPWLPPIVELWSHHLHCVMHSAPVAGLVTALAWAVRRVFWLPLLGWWSHLVIDVFTHSADYYAVPVLYPFTESGFDGIAWTTPWFMVLDYAALVLVGTWLLVRRRRPSGS